ncbi:hypothetical protein BSPWISOXPB_3484, partial [uncultured Gammaproteobacteria bacterium]
MVGFGLVSYNFEIYGYSSRQLVGLAWSDFDLENRHLIL